MGSLMDGAPPGLKTNRDHLIEYNVGCYCWKAFETAKGKKGGATGSQTQSQILSNAQHPQRNHYLSNM